MPIKGLLFSASFRVTLIYVAFFLITTFGFFWLMFSILGAEMENNARSQIMKEHARLTDNLPENSTDELLVRVRSYIGGTNPGVSLYILQDQAGNIIASNYPQGTRLQSGWMHLDKLVDAEFDALLRNAHDSGYIAFVSTIGSQKLLIGASLAQRDDTKAVLTKSLIIIFPIAAFLAILGGVIFSRILLLRIERINNQCQSIEESGDLSLRLLNDKPDDEYGLLTENINNMLSKMDLAMQNLSEVSNDIAHDLRTPLSRLKYGLESAALDPQATSGQLRETIKTSLRRTDVLLETFSAILRISQINTGLRKSKFQEFDLVSIAACVVEAYEPIAEESGHVLKLDADQPEVMLRGDKDMVTQLISNLIENNFQHGGERLQIIVEIRQGEDGVHLRISDNGKGIPDVEIENIFKKFYQLDPSRGGEGNGLGLALVKAIADLHNAGITARNLTPGLEISVFFPGAVQLANG